MLLCNDKFFYLGGLPRSGSTVLGTILSQNPDIFVSATSPLPEILYIVTQQWENMLEVKAYSNSAQLGNLWKGIRNGLYRHIDKTIIIDKARGWNMSHPIEKCRELLGEEMKIICPVDSITDILASFIMLIRKNKGHTSFIDKALSSMKADLTDENRCKYLLSPKIAGTVGWSYSNLRETFYGKNRKNLLFVERVDFISSPELVLEKIYNFLGQPKYNDHYFDDLKNDTVENDLKAYGIPNLHKIHPKLDGRKYDAEKVLGGKLFEKYNGKEFWR